PVRMVAEVLPAAARALRQHAAQGQGALRLRLSRDHPGPLARRLREDRDQAGGPPQDPEGERRAPAGARRGRERAVMTVTVNGLEEIKALAGRDLGPGEWLEITQE